MYSTSGTYGYTTDLWDLFDVVDLNNPVMYRHTMVFRMEPGGDRRTEEFWENTTDRV
jgi:hypothetical protein